MDRKAYYSHYEATETRTDAAGTYEQVARRHVMHELSTSNESENARATRQRYSSTRRRLEQLASHPIVLLGGPLLIELIGCLSA